MLRAAVRTAAIACASVIAVAALAAGRAATSAPSQSPSQPSPRHAPRVVVLGSSTAAGAGAHPSSMGWVPRYATFLTAMAPDSEVINRAVGGYMTYHLMPTGFVPPAGRPAPVADRNITYALSLHPDAIIMNLPSNDAAGGVPLADEQSNFLTIARIAKEAGVPLWVTTTQPRNFSEEKRRDQIAMDAWIRKTFGPRAIDFWTGIAQPDGRIRPEVDSGDGIHLNNLGHAILFQRVAACDVVPLPRHSR